MTCSTLEKQLETFRVAYDSTKVNVYDNYLLYVFRFSLNASRSCKQANLLIEKLGLNLVAIHYEDNSFFEVKSSEVDSI